MGDDVVYEYEEVWVEEPGTSGCLKRLLLWGSVVLAVGALLGATLSGLVTWGFLTGYYQLGAESSTNLTWAYVTAGVALFLLFVASGATIRRYGRGSTGMPLVAPLCVFVAAWLWFVQAPRLADAQIGKFCDAFVEEDAPLPSTCGGSPAARSETDKSSGEIATSPTVTGPPTTAAVSTTVAPTVTTRCAPSSLSVSALDNWTVFRQDPGLTGRPEDAKTTWRATATISNPTPYVVRIESFVAVALTRNDGSKVLVRADPLTRAQPARAGDISSSDTPQVQPGETLPVKVEVKTRTGWAVATDTVYADDLNGGPNSCRLAISGVKAYDQRPTGLPPCNSTSNATTCFR